MAAAVGRLCKPGILQIRNGIFLYQTNKYSVSSWTKGKKHLVTAIGALAGGAGALLLALDYSVNASSAIPPAKLPWHHAGHFKSLDHGSIRRGYQVYKEICSACHNLQLISYRMLVGVSHTEEEAKEEAEQIEVRDGPNDKGEYFMRPGKLTDEFPKAYPNPEAARAANNGALPPDLFWIVLARRGGENYIFHLLTGYMDPPAGVAPREGMHYNPYFPGGHIGMARPLYDGSVEYADGTPATTSQLAKDVITFLKWAGEQEYDVRAKMLIKLFLWAPFVWGIAWYYKRFVWSTLKARKIVYTPPPQRYK